MIATYTLQEKDYTGLVGDGEKSTGRLLPVLNSDEKHHFLSFSVFLIKIFLSRNMQRMLQKVPK